MVSARNIFLQKPGVAITELGKVYQFLRESYDTCMFEKFDTDYLLREHGLLVDEEYRRLSIGTELLKTMERISRVFHFPASLALLTNVSSQKLGHKLGYNLLNEVKLEEYADENGQIVFPDSAGQVVQYGYFDYSQIKHDYVTDKTVEDQE